jgi:hypothetical protein
MKIVVSDTVLGISKAIYKNSSKGDTSYYLACYSKSDYTDLIKYSVDFDFPSSSGFLKSPYFSDSALSYLGDLNPDTLDVLERFIVPTFSRLGTVRPTEKKFFGCLQSPIDTKQIYLLNIPPQTKAVELYDSESRLCATVYPGLSEDSSTIPLDLEKYETVDSVLLYIILDPQESELEVTNLALTGFYSSGTPFRNKDLKVLSKTDVLCTPPVKTGVQEELGKYKFHSVSGVLLGNKEQSLHPIADRIKSQIPETLVSWLPATSYQEGTEVEFAGNTWTSLFSGNLGNKPGLSGAWRISGESQDSKYSEVMITMTAKSELLSYNPDFAYPDFPVSPIGATTYTESTRYLDLSVPKGTNYMISDIVMYDRIGSGRVLIPFSWETYSESLRIPEGVKHIEYRIGTAKSNIRIQFHSGNQYFSWGSIDGLQKYDPRNPNQFGCYYTYRTAGDNEETITTVTASLIPYNSNIYLNGYIKDVPDNNEVTVHLIKKTDMYQFAASPQVTGFNLLKEPPGNLSQEELTEYRENPENYDYYTEYTETYVMNTQSVAKQIELSLVDLEVTVQEGPYEVSTHGSYVSYSGDFEFEIYSPSQMPEISIFDYSGTDISGGDHDPASTYSSFSCQAEQEAGVYKVTVYRVVRSLNIVLS